MEDNSNCESTLLKCTLKETMTNTFRMRNFMHKAGQRQDAFIPSQINEPTITNNASNYSQTEIQR